MSDCQLYSLQLNEAAAGQPTLRPIASTDELSAGEIHLWQYDLDCPPHVPGLLRSWLDTGELQQAAKFHFEVHRNRFIARRGMLRAILGQYSQRDPAKIEWTHNACGKPQLAELTGPLAVKFSASYSDRHAVCAVTRAGEIGVDIESLDRSSATDWAQLEDQFIHSNEIACLSTLSGDARSRACLQLWTMKEALVKAWGMGLADPLSKIDLSAILPVGAGTIHDQKGSAWQCLSVPLANHDAIVSLAMQQDAPL